MGLCHGDTKVCEAYWRKLGRCPSEVHDQVVAAGAWYLGLDAEQKKLCRMGALRPADGRSFELATKFYEEAQLHAWVTAQNLDKGITPGTRATLEQHTVLKLQSCDEPVASHVKNTSGKSAYQWLRRWRRRWSVKYDKLRPREWLSGDSKRLKVGMG